MQTTMCDMCCMMCGEPGKKNAPVVHKTHAAIAAARPTKALRASRVRFSRCDACDASRPMHFATCSDRHSRESEASTPGRETSGLWKGPLSRKVGGAKSLLKTCGRAGLWLFLLRRCSQLQSQRACPLLMDTRATSFKLVPGPSYDGDGGPTMASLLVWRSSQCLLAGQVSQVSN